jgi:hypothetical protein
MLERSCHEHHLQDGVAIETNQHMTLLASRPLSGEGWQPLPMHSVLAIQHGRIVINNLLTELTLKAQ